MSVRIHVCECGRESGCWSECQSERKREREREREREMGKATTVFPMCHFIMGGIDPNEYLLPPNSSNKNLTRTIPAREDALA